MTRQKCILLLLFFVTTLTHAQRNLLRLEGKVREGKEKLEGVRIALLSEGEEISYLTTGSNGKFLYKLPLQTNYMVVFSKRGYRSKYINVIAENIPEFDAAFGYEFGGLDVTLFKELQGLNDKILDDPIAKIIYDTLAMKFIFDARYFEQIQEGVDSLVAQLEEKQQDESELLALETSAKKAAENEEALLKEEEEKARQRELEFEKQIRLEKEAQEQKEEALKRALEEKHKQEEEIRLKTNEEERKKAELAHLEKERIAKEKYEAELREKKSEEEKAILIKLEKERIEREKAERQQKADEQKQLEIKRMQQLELEKQKEVEKERIAKVRELEEYEKRKVEFIAAKALAEAEKKKAEAEDNSKNEISNTGKDLNKTYKEGVTDKVYRQGNKTIAEKIVVEGGRVTEYRKVTADWGGRYFFKNDVSITEREYLQETEKYKKKN